MRRKALLAGLALLGLGPSVALAQYSTVFGRPGGAEMNRPASISAGAVSADSDWISLKDEINSNSTTLGSSITATSPAACTACSGAGCTTCSPCGDVCAPCGDVCGGVGVRRWNDPALRGAWLHLDYLLWRVSGYDAPPLVTASPVGTVPQLDNPDLAVLYDGDDIDDDFRSGGRVRFGVWLDDTQTAGVEGHFFALDQEKNSDTFAGGGIGADSIGRPFINVGNAGGLFGGAGPGPAALPIAFYDPVLGAIDPALGVVFVGAVEVETSSSVYSAGILAKHFLAEDQGVRIDAIGGYRFFRLDEGLLIRGTTITGPGAPLLPAGVVFQETDVFDTENDFHGAEFGISLERDFGDLISVEMIGKIAFGNVHQRVSLEGTNLIDFPGQPVIPGSGGLLVQPTNTGNPFARGSFERDEFAILPEFNINVGLQITRQVRATAGWSVLYLSDVVRPGQQIDLAVNNSQLFGGPLVGPARPRFQFDSTDVWLYGVNFGIEASY